MFDTVPAIDTWSDSAGHGGTLTYPGCMGGPACGPATPGAGNDPLPVATDSSGNVILTLTWWRPQRAGIPGAGEAAFMDIGHLAYSLNITANNGSLIPGFYCPSTTITAGSPDLTVTQAPLTTGGPNDALIDKAPDRPASMTNTLTATVNLTQCLADAGQAFAAGDTISFDLYASPQSNRGDAKTFVAVERVR